MEGSAMLTEDIPKGGRKAANVVTGKANLLVTSSMLMHSVMVNLDKKRFRQAIRNDSMRLSFQALMENWELSLYGIKP